MPIAVICGSCEARLNAPDAAAGKRVKCPKCATMLEIPLPEPEADFEVVADEPKAKPKPPAKPKPVLLEEDEDDRRRKKKPAPVEDDDEDEEPRPKKKNKGGKQPVEKSKLPLILGIGGGVLAVLGVVVWLVFFNGKGTDTVNKPGPNPQQPGSPVTPGDGGQQPGDSLAAAPRLQPVGKFKLSGKFLADAPPRFSADSRLLGVNASVNYSWKGEVWDLSAEAKLVNRFDTGILLAPDGKAVLPREYSRAVAILDVKSKQEVGKTDGYFNHAAFLNDTTYLHTLSSQQFEPNKFAPTKVWVRDYLANRDAASFEVPDDRFAEVFVTDGGTKLWLFMNQGQGRFEVQCWDVPGKKLLRTVPAERADGKPYLSTGIYRSVSFDGAVFTTDAIGKQRFYDAETGKLLDLLPAGLQGSSSGFLPFGQVYAAQVVNWERKTPPEAVLYDFRAKKVLAVLTGHSPAQSPDEPTDSSHLVVSPDGKRGVSFAKSGEALIYDLSSLNLK